MTRYRYNRVWGTYEIEDPSAPGGWREVDPELVLHMEDDGELGAQYFDDTAAYGSDVPLGAPTVTCPCGGVVDIPKETRDLIAQRYRDFGRDPWEAA